MFGVAYGVEYENELKHFYDDEEGFNTFDDAYNFGLNTLINKEFDDNGKAFFIVVDLETEKIEIFYN